MPARPAIAVRCTIALVEPPIASSTRSAFSTDFSVMICARPQRRSRPARTARAPARLGGAQAVGVHRRESPRCRAAPCRAPRRSRPWSRRCPSPRRCRRWWRGCLRSSSIPLRIHLARAMHRPEAPAVGAGAEALAAGTRSASSARRGAAPPARRPKPRPSAARARSCRSRRPAPPRPSAARGSSPRRRSTSGCGTSSRSGCRNTSPSDTVGKLDRQAAGGEHAALHRLDQLGEVAVAVVEAAARIGDADHRAGEHLARVAHALGERAAQVERERRVAVVGQARAPSLSFLSPDVIAPPP